MRPLFGELLRAVGEIDGIRRVRFTSPHPEDLRPETIEAMASTPAVCEHLHLPLQSGSDRTLAAMHRGYTAARYLERLAAARAAVPDLAVTTDIIVGFPGETDDDFERTLEVVAEARYDSAYTFIFSPRPGTEAASMTERFIAPEVSAERFERLRVVVERSRARSAHGENRPRRRGRRRGPEQAEPEPDNRPHTSEQASSLRRAVAHPRWHLRARARHGRRRAPPPGGARRCARPRSAPHSHPGGRALNGSSRAPLAIVGPTATGKSALALAVARALGHRDRVHRLDAGVSGDGHRNREAEPPRARRGAAPPHRHRRPI